VPDHEHDPPEPMVTMENVQPLLVRAQRLVDTRPSGEYPVAWTVEAEHIGDLQAIGALAVLATRRAQTTS
jgi:hypothetical protein